MSGNVPNTGITVDAPGTFSFRYWNEFKTNLFENAILVERNKAKCFIFKFQIYALIYEYSYKTDPVARKTFLPTSDLILFTPVEEKNLLDFSFKKSETIVKIFE